MVNYQLGKIYKITSIHTNNVYIGSTCVPLLCQRLQNHVYKYNSIRSGLSISYYRSFDIIKLGDYSIHLVETYPCNTKDQLLAREAHYIETTSNCINKNIPGRTMKEWHAQNYVLNRQYFQEKQKQYYEQNKEKFNEIHREYRKKNKEAIRERRSKKVVCELCKCEISLRNISVHNKTQKHILNIGDRVTLDLNETIGV